MNSSNTAKESRTIVSDTYVRFIDILFAVVLGQSFSLLTSDQGYKAWIEQPSTNAFGILTILLVYGLVITSWVGYHQSVKAYPIQSVWRFFIDVTLLFLYYLAFVNAERFDVVMLIVSLSFLAYSAWDGFRIYENRKTLTWELGKRLLCTIVFFIIYGVLYWLYSCMSSQVPETKWVFLTLAVVLLIVYRYIKWYRTR